MDSFRPLVRFAGFEGEWERVRLGELFERSSEKNDLTFGTDKIISVANMYFLKNERNVQDDYLRTYNVMRLGDIAFEGNKSKNFAHGRFVENTIGDGIVSHVFVVLKRANGDYDLNFWKYYINDENVMGSILTRSTKSSTMMNDIVVDDFLKESILVPSYEEQKVIGAFLTKLDEELTLQTQKLSKLKQIKAASLQNMFPQEGETVPLVRFSGFGGEWKKVPFAEIAVRAEQSGVSGELPGVEYEDIVSGQGILNKDILKKECVKCGKLFHSGDILFGKLRPYLKNILFADFDGVAVGDFWVLRSTNSVNRFLYTIVNSYSFMKVANVSSGSKMPRADWKLVSSTRFAVPPTIEEQQAIANYFTKLDRKIELETQKLEKLKQIKSACLSKMFV